MRIRLPIRRVVLFAALLALALILTLPLRVAIGGSGLQAREASGSVWSGRLNEARLGPAALGDLDARLAFLPLLTARARVEVSRDSAGPDRFTGAMTSSARMRSAESVTGSIPIQGALGALPLAALDLTDVTIRFRDGTCDKAEGLVRATLTIAQPGLPSALSGSARCDRGALLLPLATGSGVEGIALRMLGDGRWTAELRLRGGPGGTLSGHL